MPRAFWSFWGGATNLYMVARHATTYFIQHRLNFLPDPHPHLAFLPAASTATGCCVTRTALCPVNLALPCVRLPCAVAICCSSSMKFSGIFWPDALRSLNMSTRALMDWYSLMHAFTSCVVGFVAVRVEFIRCLQRNHRNGFACAYFSSPACYATIDV
jgi:hypothetical protein